MGPSFVALDFELANASHASIDSAGITRVTDGNVGPPRHWYCRPCAPYDFMERRNITLTGIVPSDLVDARPFAWLGPHLVRNIADNVVVAHSAKSADLSMLEQSWIAAGLGTPPSWRYVCTLEVAQQVLPGLESYRLDQLVGQVLGEPMVGHHRADADAHATARLLLALLDRSGTSLDDWVQFRAGRGGKRLKPPTRGRSARPIGPIGACGPV